MSGDWRESDVSSSDEAEGDGAVGLTTELVPWLRTNAYDPTAVPK